MITFPMRDGDVHNHMRYAAMRFGAHVDENPWAVWLVKNGVRVRAGYRGRVPDARRLEMLAIPVPPGLPRFRLWSNELGAESGYGRHPVEPEDSDFRHVFKLVADEPEVVRALFSQERTAFLRAHLADSEIRCSGNELTLLRPSKYDTADDGIFDLGIRVLLDIGTHDAYARAALLSLPGARYQPLPKPRFMIAAPAPLWFWYVRNDDELLATQGCASTDLDEIPADVTAQADAFGATASLDFKTFVLTWPTVVRDIKVLLAAVDLLRGLISGPHEGVFR